MRTMLHFAWLLIFVAVSGINAETGSDCLLDISKHPYIVSIKKNDKHTCSGVILDKYHIVTSDKCVPPFKHVWNLMHNIAVVSGTNSLKIAGHQINSKEMFSQNHYLNPSRNPVISSLGVIKLATPLQFGDKVQPIEISNVEELAPGAKVQVVGWMMTGQDEKKTACLGDSMLEIVDRQTCQTFHKKTLTESEFCTQLPSAGGLCQGDSGSPVIYEGKLIGVTTFGISCSNPAVPDVHPNIHKNIEYLNKIMKK